EERRDEIIPRTSSTVSPLPTVNLPQLPLATFDGDLKGWRQFWSNFEVAVHNQNIPDIQKLNYLISSLKGNALLAVEGFDIVPENYSVVRSLLLEKYGNSHIIKKAFYYELSSMKKNDKEWKTTIDVVERILRQLEALGDNLEHPSIDSTMESKLPAWILDRVLQAKAEAERWSVYQFRKLLLDIVARNNEVARTQAATATKTTEDRKPSKFVYKGETSALAVVKSTEPADLKQIPERRKARRPFVVCNKDHWDNECHIYPTLKVRMERLRKTTACLKCFRTGHATSNCKTKKLSCFYCKSPHKTALCPTKYKES
ncbi:unnamed protein product, partial [Acanthocheilonema viteae]